MNLKSGYPYWLLKHGLPNTYPSLKKNHKCEVLVIGGGISGVLTAYHLTKAGMEVTQVDGRHFGTGSTCASTALIQYETDRHLTDLAEMYGKDKAIKCHELTLTAVNDLSKLIKLHNIECEFKNRDSLYLASTLKDKAKLTREYEARLEAGFELELWDKAKIESKFPFSAPAAIWSKNGAELNALKLTYALLKINSRLGVSLFDGTRVVQINKTKGKYEATTNHDTKIQCRHIVIACGYESELFLQNKISSLNSTYALVSEPVLPSDLWYRSCLIWETARPYIYMRTTSDNRIVVGGKDEPFYNPKKRDSLLNKKTKDLTRSFVKKFPTVPFFPEFTWTGTFAETKDSLPYIDKYRGLIYVMGFGGNGITYSQMAGKLVADIIKGKNNPDLELFAFNR
ncbi:MAG: FAD-binding oxidoreductase [Bacteroidetes bacterium]|nr:FAD-binding oxidoreductase [Bacteroidota bacterium]